MKITNREIQILNDSANILQVLIKKDFTTRTSYFLALILKELEIKSEIYNAERKKIIDKFAIRDDKDEIIQEDGRISISDIIKFNDEIFELLKIELDLNIKRINFDVDKEPSCSVEEMSLLIPFIEVI